ncbi:MAG: DUF1697 domain-containing protein [Chlorobiaceae bacterium]|nr:DUF1697 domain-containing protein [Chlorobiaceae bacterium]
MPTPGNKVPMADLRSALIKAGLLDVRTHIQSGNVVAKTPLDRVSLQVLVQDVIERDIGVKIKVLVRTHYELEDIMAGNPFPATAASRIYFSMLASPPEKSFLEEFFLLNFSPDEVKVIGSTIYTMYATRYSDSKYNNNFFERKLKVVCTTRNFNTMSRLVEMTA